MMKVSDQSENVQDLRPVHGEHLRRLAAVLRLSGKFSAGAIIATLFVLTAVFAPVLAPDNPSATRYGVAQPPSWHHLLGTTRSGQDIFSQLIWGTRQSLEIAFLVGIFSTVAGIIVGLVAAYRGGWIDDIFMLLTNVVLVIPGLVLVIVISSYLAQSNNVVIAAIIALTSWPWGARVFRAQALSIKAKDFVLASVSVGEGVGHVVLADILPNMLSLVAANFLFTSLYAILTAASLQFLGLGNINAISWGSMLYWANNSQALLTGEWWWFAPPGLAIGILGGSLALMNFGLDEITNPRLKRGK
jgi:peptide/nickel transport system permease protein